MKDKLERSLEVLKAKLEAEKYDLREFWIPAEARSIVLEGSHGLACYSFVKYKLLKTDKCYNDIRTNFRGLSNIQYVLEYLFYEASLRNDPKGRTLSQRQIIYHNNKPRY